MNDNYLHLSYLRKKKTIRFMKKFVKIYNQDEHKIYGVKSFISL